jgi:hypothetical protein
LSQVTSQCLRQDRQKTISGRPLCRQLNYQMLSRGQSPWNSVASSIQPPNGRCTDELDSRSSERECYLSRRLDLRRLHRDSGRAHSHVALTLRPAPLTSPFEEHIIDARRSRQQSPIGMVDINRSAELERDAALPSVCHPQDAKVDQYAQASLSYPPVHALVWRR